MTTPITVLTGSKPDLLADLRRTWRASSEHRTEQIKLFLSTFLGLVVLQVLSDLSAGKSLSHLTDLHSLWVYLLPIALVAWRQVHPALTASGADSAPGVTIVPEQVGAGVVPPAEVVQTDNRPRPGIDPDVEPDQDSSMYVGANDDLFDPAVDPITPPDEPTP